MNIKPLKSYATPAYPTHEESKQDARLLEHLPKNWMRRHPAASWIGSGLLVQLTLAGCRDNDTGEPKAKVQILAPSEHEQDGVKQHAARELPATRVAPILEEALANDGRGSFGCVAVSSPVFLSENEAIDLIQAELEKTGLKFHDLVDIDGLQIPDRLADPKDTLGRFRDFNLKPLVKGTHTFDLGTADKSVVVHFLSNKDFDQWQDDPNRYFTTHWDYAWLATQVRDAFKQREDGDPVVIGLFFEPSEKDIFDLDRDFEKSRQNAHERSREKLRKQVEHFVAYLKQEGVVE